MKRVTIKDIAKAANVSVATVSRALRSDYTVKPETTKKIIQIAESLNYLPNFSAKSLRLKKSNTIGVIFNDLNNPFYTEILSEITSIVNEKNYNMIVCHSKYSLESEEKNIFSLLSRNVDGIIISPVDSSSKNMDILLNNQVETIFIDCLPYYKDQCYIYTEQRHGIKLSFEYLIKNGHKNIVLLICPMEKPMSDLFVSTFISITKEYKLKIKENSIIECDDFSIDGGFRAFKKFLTEDISLKNYDFTGVVAINDLLAIGVYKAANELGFNIPGNYSVMGYDDIEITGILKPPLTTVHQSRKRIGRESVNKLLYNIENKKKDRNNIVFNPYIVMRGSVRNIQ